MVHSTGHILAAYFENNVRVRSWAPSMWVLWYSICSSHCLWPSGNPCQHSSGIPSQLPCTTLLDPVNDFRMLWIPNFTSSLGVEYLVFSKNCVFPKSRVFRSSCQLRLQTLLFHHVIKHQRMSQISCLRLHYSQTLLYQ